MIVYLAHNLVTHKNYVGQTVRTLQQRIGSHLRTKRVLHLYNAIRKYGTNNFQWIILRECNSIDEMNFWEEFYIKLFSSTNREFGYNISKGGFNHRLSDESKDKLRRQKIGIKRDVETIRKIVASKKGKYTGKLNPFYGKHHSEETKQKLAEKFRGIKRDKNIVDKQRETLRKKFRENPEKFQQLYNASIKPKSEATKMKMSEARKKYWDKKKAING